MPQRPNLVFVLADQLRAASLPLYGETQIRTPHIDRLADQGVTFTNCVASYPMCTPYRGMLLTGRHPQTTGLLINAIRIRHTEISVADAFNAAGYCTGWVGKWHLHHGAWPANNVPDWVPEDRSRMGFQYWRAYNMHMVYFDGFINGEDWDYETWDGYETNALNQYGFEFMDECGDDPFALFLSPHQPHFTPYEFAPQDCYDRVPEQLQLPPNVPDQMREQTAAQYRHYLAMTIALDDMVGDLMDYLERTGRADDTLLVFTSDHGTQGGAHGIHFWTKKHPYEESLRVPCVARFPGVLEAGRSCDALMDAVDFFPTLCSLCGVPIPRSVEGLDLSAAWRGEEATISQDAILTMNFSREHDWLVDGWEWRGVRTPQYHYTRWLNGTIELYDLANDSLQQRNLAGDPAYGDLQRDLDKTLRNLQRMRGDELRPSTDYRHWLDSQRRIVRNGFGALGDPEGEPDWSLLESE